MNLRSIRRPRDVRLTVEALEDRAVPAAFAVGNGAELAAALLAANGNAEADTIQATADFALPAALAFAADAERVTFDGQGHALAFAGAAGPAVTVALGAKVELRNLSLTTAATAAAIGIANEGELDLRKVTFAGSGSAGGAGLVNVGWIGTIADSRFTGSDAGLDGDGGGIRNHGRIVSIVGTVVEGNSARDGGGLWNGGTIVSIANSTLAGNRAERGGGIFNFGAFGGIAGTTFSGNVASDRGGGLFNRGGIGGIANSTFAGNEAAGGGAIANVGATGQYQLRPASGAGADSLNPPADGASIASIANSTISGNVAAARGGSGILNVEAAIFALSSSILSNNRDDQGNAGNDYHGALPHAADHNVLGTGAGFAADLANVLTDDPNLGALADHGGPTKTLRPNPGSPAIDRGANALGLTIDQRGQPRVFNLVPDIGAVETGDEAPIEPPPPINPLPSPIDPPPPLPPPTPPVPPPVPPAPPAVPPTTPPVPDPSGVLGSVEDVTAPPETPLGGGVLHELYRRLLGREPDAAGLAGYARFLEEGGTLAEVVRSICESPERRTLQVQSYYWQFLGRPADAAGLASTVTAFLAGASEEQIVAGFLTSAEFRALHPAPEGFVEAVFQKLLHRAVDLPAGQPFVVAAAAGNFADVVDAVLHSTERRNANLWALYRQALGRSPSAAELASYPAGAAEKDLALSIFASAEFVVRAES